MRFPHKLAAIPSPDPGGALTVRRLQQSLKFQIILAIGLLALLFAASTLYSLHVIDQQHSDHVLLQLAGRLQFNQQHLTVQAMRYKENAPRDYPSYYRDLRLYFEDLKKTRAALSQIIVAFAHNRFDQVLAGESMAMQPHLGQRSLEAAEELGTTWQRFSAQLDERIGTDPEEPRLEWAAEWIVEANQTLEHAAERLMATLENDVASRAARANLVNRVLLISALLVAFGIAAWFYRRVLAPLSGAVDGFRQVANGDFSHRVPIAHDNEIGSLADSFNHLSGRMDALRKLLTRLEQGANLEGTLSILSETLPPLIPVDWIGVLVVGVDRHIHLEMAFSDGKPDSIGKLSFDPDRTLLEECISSHEPLHIADVREMASLSESYVFLQKLSELGRRDAVFLPISSGVQIQGVAVFASRFPNNFNTEHLALLRNLGVLVGVSLGRTIQLVENSRLANIGQFASGIAHEIRNPLATIGLALEHLKGLEELPAGAAKRVALASEEVTRLEGLLSDILLYAKPLALNRSPQDLVELLGETVAAETAGRQPIEIISKPCPLVPADRDRIRQVLINLVRNAQQASPDGSPISIKCRPSGAGWVEVEILNGGPAIPEKILERVFEPFVTTKSGGTGLGLPIAKRIVTAHGGAVEIASDAHTGTRVRLRLPSTAGEAQAADQAGAERASVD
jgi:signal transduction histidine kinase/HAMP domain-containing protein